MKTQKKQTETKQNKKTPKETHAKQKTKQKINKRE